FGAEWPKDEQDKIHYMSFVTQEVWSPGEVCLTIGGTCAATTVTLRNSFLRVPPEHDYAVATLSHREYERFGIIRSHQPTYARGGEDREVQHEFCIEDADCGEGGACDAARNVCVGGLTADRGETDFLSFYASRQNLHRKSLGDKACVANWECDGRNLTCDDVSGGSEREACEQTLLDMQGSACDPAARRCTIPVRAREIRPIVYHLNKHFPPYLVRETFAAVAQWNEALMRGNRAARSLPALGSKECDEDEEDDLETDRQQKGDGLCTVDLGREAAIDCQDSNPAEFCFCGSPEEQGGVCYRAYDPFEAPEDARARGVLGAYDCYVKGPTDVEHPAAYDDYDAKTAYGYRFEGKECALTVTPNACDLDDKAACEELGDLRYQFITHLQHGAVSFGGVAQPLSDPTTGELIVSNATMAAESIESVGTTASQFFPVLRGETAEDRYFSGENLRGYYSRLGRVTHPVSLAASGTDGYSVDDASRPSDSHADVIQDLTDRMTQLEPRMKQLQGQEGRVAILSDRVRTLRGTEVASRFDSALSTEAASLVGDTRFDPANGGSVLTGQPSAGVAEPKSLLQQSPLDQVLAERAHKTERSSRFVDDFESKLYNSQYWEYWANAFEGYSDDEAALRLQQLYYRGVAVHEVGHALGLEHNFAASLDRDNYPDSYFKIARERPLPAYLDYDSPLKHGNNDGQVTGEEAQLWAEDLRKVRIERLQRGAGNVMTASAMDYAGDLSEFAGIGRYDAAAVMFGYFDRVEAFSLAEGHSGVDFDQLAEGFVANGVQASPTSVRALGPQIDPKNPTNVIDGAASLSGLEYSDSYPRTLWTYYRGGETCSSDADCPFAAGKATVEGQPIAQRCVSNQRVPNTTGNCGDGGCVCSGFYDDFNDYSAARAYRKSSSPLAFAPVSYLYCNDNRANDLSWCTKSDAGESFQEVVDHYRLGWLQRYPQAYFRNFRRNGPSRGYSQATVIDAVKIYQHLFFRYNYEGDAFRNSAGPLGFNDQLLASADAFNWLGEIIGSPDVGSYALDDDNVYRQISTDPGAAGADFSLNPGQGFYLWSAYQAGQNGFFRLERAGTFLDKLLAIESVARRDWGLSFTIDERYYINFYDLFEREVIDMFGGLILRNPKAYAPRVTMDSAGEPVVHYLDLYRERGRANNEATYTQPTIDGTDSEVLRDAAAIQALSSFPIFYDTSFEQRLLVFKTGSGDGYTLPETRKDGTPICAYGTDGCDVPDYIVYDSDRLHTSYVAVIIHPQGSEGTIDEQQLGYELLLRLRGTQDRVRELQALSSRNTDEDKELKRLRLDLERDESFVDYLIELGRMFGISTYLF
ncbi:MAG TPA: zinc-dependent metalloprotease, partial [Polyangiales bacterium]|nr:zinc-dependent metalloprotease [Polyangiales bacterium]